VSVFTRALLEAVLLGAACGPLGVWLLAYRQAYAAESLAHAMLPGLALAAVAGLPFVLGAAGGVLAAALLVALAARDRHVGGELAVAVVVTAAFGTGALLALSDATPRGLSELLFGDLLGTTTANLVAAAALGLGVAAALAATHRMLAVGVFDPGAARSLGARPARAELGLLVLLAMALVVAVQALGNLLVVALLIAPGIAAGRLASRLAPQLAVAALVGAGSGAVGLLASDRLSVAAGASVAMTACVAALLAVTLRAPRGGAGASVRPSPLEALGAPR
jgi:ABC-type Mn2+/Zn2+ transport system permease subunit